MNLNRQSLTNISKYRYRACLVRLKVRLQPHQTCTVSVAVSPSSFQMSTTAIVALNKENVATNIVHHPRIITALCCQVGHPSSKFQGYMMNWTFKFQLKTSNRTANEDVWKQTTLLQWSLNNVFKSWRFSSYCLRMPSNDFSATFFSYLFFSYYYSTITYLVFV